MRILIVDDEFLSREKLTHFLSSYGMCDSVASMAEAKILFEKAIEDELPYDLISIDIHLPDGSGLDLLSYCYQREKELLDGWFSKKIVVTGDRDLETVQKAIGYKCDMYMVKPITQKTVETKMRQIWH
ncbi:response regulator [Spirochaetia bacterium 38H-sp]|uniref:Response regulator n=1 Tax=Rarispira pelagica TaxID=3141764 RepID=A0ABU9U8N9_9SPIR